MLVYTKSAIEHRVLASTQRGIVNPIEKGSATAVGEMLDKCARAIIPERLIPNSNAVVYAKEMERYCAMRSMWDAYQAPQKSEVYQSVIGPWSVPPPLRQSQEMMYNFTGLGGKVRAIMRERPDMPGNERAELAYTTMRLAFEHIMSRVIMALENDEELLANPPQSLVISGGVASNRFLKTVVTSALQARGFGNVTVTVPKPQYCTDNAPMVAWAGLKMYEAGWTTDKSFLPLGEWPIEEIITGVDCWLQNGVAASPGSTSKTAASQPDTAQLPDKSKPQDPPLTSTADVPTEPDAVAAPNAKSVAPTEDEVSESKSKSDNKKPSAKPDPGPSSAQDVQHAAGGEGPGSPQEDTARTPPSQASDSPAQSGRSPRALTGRTKANAQPASARRVTEKRDDPIKQLNEAERQLLGPTARRPAEPLMRPRPSLELRGPNETRPVDGRIAKPDYNKRPAGQWDSPVSAKKRVADGARRDPEKGALEREEVLRVLNQIGAAVESELRAKAQAATTNKPQRRPSATSPVGKNRANDGAKREPLRAYKVQTEGKEKVKAREDEEKKEKRFVRLLPPAPADEQAPEGSLRTGLNRLKSWIGL
ncbi:hypothetical protein INS49_008678 [Diaporthe citri]|uniref:uncharacterized protein n=1 Tax=Diaporthe citri TaxID=83186 RepID=UPI001C8177DF|nr:uncharacterized protein INS49_008678 [Diaporthe citri]KAG6363577.1 hypothetical protein INS49_008678 [Diaporthe citri]